MRWFLSAVRCGAVRDHGIGRGRDEGAAGTLRLYAPRVHVYTETNGGGVLADTRPSGLSIIIIGVQAPRRIRSH